MQYSLHHLAKIALGITFLFLLTPIVSRLI
jgi:hypothetical protein